MAQNNQKSKGNSYRYHGQKPYGKNTKNSLINNLKNTISSYIPSWLKSDDYGPLSYPSTSHNQITSKLTFDAANLLSEDEDDIIPSPKNLSPNKLKPYPKTNGYIINKLPVESTLESLGNQEDSFHNYEDAFDDPKQSKKLLNSSNPYCENIPSDKSSYIRTDNNIQTNFGIKNFNISHIAPKYNFDLGSKFISPRKNIEIDPNRTSYLNQSAISSFTFRDTLKTDVPHPSYTSLKNNNPLDFSIDKNSSLFNLSKKHIENVQQNLSHLGSNFGKTKYGGSSAMSVNSNLKRKQRLSLFTPYQVSNEKKTNAHATTSSMSGLNDKAQKILSMLGNIADQNQEGLNEVSQNRAKDDEPDTFPSRFQSSSRRSVGNKSTLVYAAPHKVDQIAAHPLQNTSLFYQHSPLFFKPPKAKTSSPQLGNSPTNKHQSECDASFSLFKQPFSLMPRPGQEPMGSGPFTSHRWAQEVDMFDQSSATTTTQYVDKKIRLKPKLGPPIAGLKYLASPYSNLGAPKPLMGSNKEEVVSTGDHLKAQTTLDGSYVKSPSFYSTSTSQVPTGASLSFSQSSSMEYIKDRPEESSKTANKYVIPDFSFPQPEIPQIIRVVKNEHVTKSRFSQDLHSKFMFKPYVTSAHHTVAPKSPSTSITTTAPAVVPISPKASNTSAHPYKRFEKYDTDRRKAAHTSDINVGGGARSTIVSCTPSLIMNKGSCLDVFGTSSSINSTSTSFNSSAPTLAPPQTKDDQWECSSCWVKNKGSAMSCVCCETKKPLASNATTTPDAGVNSDKFKFGMGTNAINSSSSSAISSTFRFVTPSPSSSLGSGDLSKPNFTVTTVPFKMAAPQGWTCVCSTKNLSSASKCQLCNTPRLPPSSPAKEITSNFFAMSTVASSFFPTITPTRSQTPPAQTKTSTFGSSVSNSPMDTSLTSSSGTSTPSPITFGTSTISFGAGRGSSSVAVASSPIEPHSQPFGQSFSKSSATSMLCFPATIMASPIPTTATAPKSISPITFPTNSTTCASLFGSVKTATTLALTSVAPPSNPYFGSASTPSSAADKTPFTSSLFQSAGPQPDFKPILPVPFKFEPTTTLGPAITKTVEESKPIVSTSAAPVPAFSFGSASLTPSFATPFGSTASINTARVAPQPAFSFGDGKIPFNSNSTTGQATIFKTPTGPPSFSFGAVNTTSLQNGPAASGFSFPPLVTTTANNQTVSGFNFDPGFNFGVSTVTTAAASSAPLFNFTQTINKSSNATGGSLFNFGSGQASSGMTSAPSLFGSNPPTFTFGAPGGNQVTTAPPSNDLFTFGSNLQQQHPTAQVPPLNGPNPSMTPFAAPPLQNSGLAFNFTPTPAPVLGLDGGNPILGGFAMGSASTGQRKIKKPIRRLR